MRAIWSGADAGSLSDSELIAVHERYCRMRRMLDADQTALAAEIARRSRPELGSEGLAKTQGYRNPTALIAATGGTSTGDAARLVKVGEATAPRQLLSGEKAPARHPHVAAALAAATLTERAAGAIIALLDRVAFRAGAEALDAAEKTLVEQAPGLTMDQLNRVLARAEAWLDPDGVAPREDEKRGPEQLSMREVRRHVRVHRPAHPRTRRTGQDRHRSPGLRRDARHPRCRSGTGPPTRMCRAGRWCRCRPTRSSGSASTRSAAPQTDCRCTGRPSWCGSTTTTRERHRVRHDRRDHRPGLGLHRPRMAAGGQIISCVLGGDSQILDWGRTKRLFTPTQRLVLVERDGGCAMCGAPPGHTKVHHIRWWARDAGPTDLDNGVLLCESCHHRIHDNGWDIRIDGIGDQGESLVHPPTARRPHPHTPPRRTSPLRLRRLKTRASRRAARRAEPGLDVATAAR